MFTFYSFLFYNLVTKWTLFSFRLHIVYSFHNKNGHPTLHYHNWISAKILACVVGVPVSVHKQDFGHFCQISRIIKLW
jgi:hypothetical protein